MKKFLTVVLILCLMLTFIPMRAFADDNNDLPLFELPKLEQQQPPSLSKNYQDMLDEIKKQGFGQYKYDQQKPLPLPEVEPPDNAGKTGYEKFLEEYGDMWNSPEHQLDKTSIIPDDQFFKDYINTFKSANEKLFNDIKKSDREKMNELLNKKLDLSGLWNLEDLKKQIQFKDTKSLLASVPKPDGWDAVKAKSFKVPNMNDWLNNGPKAEGYGEGNKFLPFLLDKLKIHKDSQTPTPPAPQPQTVPQTQTQAVPSFVPDPKPSFVPEAGKIPGFVPTPSSAPSDDKKEEKEHNPGLQPSPAPAPSFSAKLQSFGHKTLEVGKKAAPYIAIAALVAAACAIAGPVGLAVAAI